MVVVLTAPMPTSRMPSRPLAASIFGGFFTTANYIISAGEAPSASPETFMKLFRIFKTPGEPLAVSMAGIKLGDRLLLIGCGDPMLLAQLAVKTGLTGRAFAADVRPELTAAAERVAAREGALIEAASGPWDALPVESGTFDVAVVRYVFSDLPEADRLGCAAEIHRALRPGGRCLTIDPAPGSGLGSVVRRTTMNRQYAAGGGAVRVLEAAGFRAARVLAEREGLAFCEAAKANT
jgi:SAM-dependent methyltransferase